MSHVLRPSTSMSTSTSNVNVKVNNVASYVIGVETDKKKYNFDKPTRNLETINWRIDECLW